jgi:hypothetical protein
MEYGLVFSFFSFLCFGNKILQRGSGGREIGASVVGGTIWCAPVLSFFKARFALFRRPMVNMCLPALLPIVLRFYRCLLQLKSSPVYGAWSSRARVFSPLGLRVMATFRLCCHVWWLRGLMVFSYCRGSSGADACSTSIVSGGAFFRRQLLGVFPVGLFVCVVLRFYGNLLCFI